MTKDEQIKKWVTTWEKAGESLESEKKAELQDENYYLKNREVLNQMLQYAFDHRRVRLNSGLVIQQKFFKSFYLKNK